MPTPAEARPVLDRIWEKVERGATNECWFWKGRTRNGYGRLGVGSRADGTRRQVTVTRAIYESELGPIPDGLDVCHLCDNPSCCNPAHLRIGTRGENLREAYARKRREGWAPPRYVPPVKPPQPCADCGKLTKPTWRGRCQPCYGRWRRSL